MRLSLVVLDFDGTLTDADAHAEAFMEASVLELARRLGRDETTGRKVFRQAFDRIAAYPPEVAWTTHGRGVCPAATDLYVTANSAVKALWAGHDPALSERDLAMRVMEVHRAAYDRVPSPFRTDACALLDALGLRGIRAAVVTNSPPETVAARLAELPCTTPHHPAVHGNAAKFSVSAPVERDARFDKLPEQVVWPELTRPVELKRGHYFDALSASWREANAAPESTLVVGDNFELDLAMPVALGAHVHLVTRRGTMPHERAMAERLERSASGPDLMSVITRLDSM